MLDNSTKSTNDINVNKVINIVGTGQRYQMKNVMKIPKQIVALKSIEKMRSSSSDDHLNMFCANDQRLYLDKLQFKLSELSELSELSDNSTNPIVILIENQMKKKRASYKQQDVIKKRHNNDTFITFTEIVDLIDKSNLLCHYCNELVYILYEYAREKKQWTLDRIDNDIGHSSTNVVLSCLDCNLKRRRIRKDAFIFTKNMNIVRIPEPESESESESENQNLQDLS
jgi:hypothetical protein